MKGIPAIAVFGLALCLPAAPAAQAGPQGGDGGRTVLILPFGDLTGHAEAVRRVEEALRAELARRGLTPVNGAPVRAFLRERRWRSRHALSTSQHEELGRRFGARYVLSGRVRAWADGDGPEVGLSARLVDARQGRLVWADSVTLHCPPERGLIPALRRKPLETLASRAVRRLVSGLQVRRRDGVVLRSRVEVSGVRRGARPVAFAGWGKGKERFQGRVALLPLDNRAGRPEASDLLLEHLVSYLAALPGVEVILPGDVRETLIREQIQPLYGVGPEELRRIGEALHADAILDGVLLDFENRPGRTPRVGLSLRLRRVPDGDVLWMAALDERGEERGWIYDLGRARTGDRLAARAARKLLAAWRR